MKRSLIFVLLVCLLLGGCGAAEAQPVQTLQPDEGNIAADKPLICPAETVAEAEEIAELYGIELVDCSYGVACFYTGEDPFAVIERGKENGWPRLDINYIITVN